MVPSGSEDADALNVIATFTVAVRSGPAFAIGGWFGLVVLVVDEIEVVVVGRAASTG